MVGESRRSASKWYAYFLAIGSLAGTIIGLGMFQPNIKYLIAALKRSLRVDKGDVIVLLL